MPLTREEQAIYGSSRPSDPVVYDLYGKMSMLRGGVGCIRLKERETADGRLYFMSASTSLSAHEGVPLALTAELYEQYIDEVTERGTLPCTVTGKLMFLPDSLLSLYRDYAGVPRLYVLVSEIVPARSVSVLQHGDPTVSVAVLFAGEERWLSVNAERPAFVLLYGGCGSRVSPVWAKNPFDECWPVLGVPEAFPMGGGESACAAGGEVPGLLSRRAASGSWRLCCRGS
jgi:hypothetical protein